jgi:hypothetical protein
MRGLTKTKLSHYSRTDCVLKLSGTCTSEFMITVLVLSIFSIYIVQKNATFQWHSHSNWRLTDSMTTDVTISVTDWVEEPHWVNQLPCDNAADRQWPKIWARYTKDPISTSISLNLSHIQYCEVIILHVVLQNIHFCKTLDNLNHMLNCHDWLSVPDFQTLRLTSFVFGI